MMEIYHLELPDRTVAYRLAGSGDRLVVLLHGWPQTGACWRKIVPALARHYTVAVPDLRGYGSSRAAPHLAFDKRSVAADLTDLVNDLGFQEALVAGHDRGARVAHRWALDEPSRVRRLALLDIIPTREVRRTFDLTAGQGMWHWLFHLQPGVPERLLDGRLRDYLTHFLSVPMETGALDSDVLESYLNDYDNVDMHGWLEDYRASFATDALHDDADFDADRHLNQPLLVLWGSKGQLGDTNVLATWHDYAEDVRGGPVEDCGHYLPEEQPGVVAHELRAFFDEAV
jgi:haloacetate dehalogenase